MRKTLKSVSLLLVGLVVGVLVTRGFAPPPVTPARVLDVNAGLERMVGPARFEGMPLDQALGALAGEAKAALRVDWKALALTAVVPTQPVNLKVERPVTLRAALQEMLDHVASSRGLLGIRASDDGAVRISTREALDLETVIRMYPVRDLLAHRVRWPAPRFGWRGQVGGASLSSDPSAPADPEVAAVEDLLHLITETVAPDSWREAGGVTGSLYDYAGVLVVTQTPENHDEVAALLGQLREVMR